MALSRKIRRYRGWLAAGALILVAIAVWFFVVRPASQAKTPQTTYTTEAAATGTLSVTVSGSGNLAIDDESEVWPATSGTVDEIKVKTGDRIEKGDVLFTLDGEDAQAATAKAYTSYLQAKSGYLKAQNSVDKAESSVDRAERTLTKAENAYDAAEEKLAELEDEYGEPSSTVRYSDITAAENAVDSAADDVDSAEDDIDTAKADVVTARADLATAKASRDNALADYNDTKDAEAKLTVKAPIDGTVWTVNIDEGEVVSAKGGSSSSSSSSSGASAGSSSSGSSAPIVIMPNKPLSAVLTVNEVDVPALKVGQSAEIEFDALPDLTMTGKVTDIAEEGAVSSGVVTYDVTVTLDVTNKQLKPGMTVAATIVTNVVRDALLVPNAAVKTDSTTEENYVLVLGADGKTTTEKTVETGLAGDSQTQVLSGIAEGDKVVTSTTSASDSESEDSGSNSGGGFMMMGGGPPGGGR